MTPRPLLVVVQGAPGSGKTTLLRRLKTDIDLPMLGKDDIKELLFDRLSQSDLDFSRLQGKASFDMLYSFATTFLQNGHSVLIEGAFHTELSRANIKKILQATGATAIELFCHVDEATRQTRYEARANDGSRHPSHLDSGVRQQISGDNYQQLEIGELVDIDTTAPLDGKTYEMIVTKINNSLQNPSGEGG